MIKHKEIDKIIHKAVGSLQNSSSYVSGDLKTDKPIHRKNFILTNGWLFSHYHSTITEQLLINVSRCMQPMEANPKRGRGQDREKQRDNQKNINIVDKSPTMIEYTQIHVH